MLTQGIFLAKEKDDDEPNSSIIDNFDDLPHGIHLTTSQRMPQPPEGVADSRPITDTDFWGYTICIAFDPNLKFQIAFLTGTRAGIYYRDYSGTPLHWTTWKKIAYESTT